MYLYKIVYSFVIDSVVTYRIITYKTYSKKSLLEYVYKNCKPYEQINRIELKSILE